MFTRAVAVVLAAGEGKRMNSQVPKVLHPLCGRPMITYVVAAVQEAGIKDIILVMNPAAAGIKEVLGEKVRYVYQEERLGTGHATLQAQDSVAPDRDTVVVLSGDIPLLTPELLARLVSDHHSTGAAVTVITTQLPDPTGYGRIIRDREGRVVRIVEEADATPEEKVAREVNAGIYAFDRERLFTALTHLSPTNAQGEYYLTDVLTLFYRQGLPLAAMTAEPAAVMGINNRKQLAEAERVMRSQIRERLMFSGVTIADPASTFIDADVVIGRDTVILPFSMITGGTVIGENCTIGPGAQIHSATVSAGVRIVNSVIVECQLGPGVQVGPFAYLRPGTVLDAGAKAGAFVEIKKSYVGANSKVPHLSYVGDTQIGEDANIGAGTITCNYDGWEKHRTVIGRGAFIGSNTNLVAPVHIGEKAVTGAGSTITRDVPDYALALERCEQVNVVEWMKKKLRKKGCLPEEKG